MAQMLNISPIFGKSLEFLNISHQTIYKLMEQGLPSHKIGRKRVFLNRRPYSMDRWIKEAESSLAPLEERKSALDEEVQTLETKLAEKSELMKHVGQLEKLDFNIEMLRQLKDALTEIGAKHGLKGKEATGKFFADLKDYEAVLRAELQLKGLQTQIDTRSRGLDTAGKRLEGVRKEASYGACDKLALRWLSRYRTYFDRGIIFSTVRLKLPRYIISF